MLQFLSIIPNVYLADLFMVSATLLVLLIGILGIVLYKKIAFLSMPLVVVLTAALIVLPNFITLPEFIYIIADARE